MPTVKEQVKVKLPFLTSSDDPMVDMFELEVMILLQKCLKKEDSQIGVDKESFYTPLELSLISDIVAIKILIRKTIETASGSGSSGGSGGGGITTYLKRAKAGTTEAEFAIPSGDNSSSTIGLNTNDLLKYISKEALIKAGLLKCNIAAMLTDLPVESAPVPFIYVPYTDDCNSCGC